MAGGGRNRSRPLSRSLVQALLLLVLSIGWLGLAAPSAMAAAILGVPSPTLLRVGDQNRGYLVELACLAVEEANSQPALDWLRRHGTRGTRVNLRPVGQHDGLLVAHVRVLSNGLDLGEGLVAERLATVSPCPEGGAAG